MFKIFFLTFIFLSNFLNAALPSRDSVIKERAKNTIYGDILMFPEFEKYLKKGFIEYFDNYYKKYILPLDESEKLALFSIFCSAFTVCLFSDEELEKASEEKASKKINEALNEFEEYMQKIVDIYFDIITEEYPNLCQLSKSFYRIMMYNSFCYEFQINYFLEKTQNIIKNIT